MPVHERRAVVQAVGVGDDLPVGPLLRHLLEVAVHVADLGLGVDDRLPVEPRLHAEGPVHGRVGRADVDDQVLRARRDLQQQRFRRPEDVAPRGGVVLPHRVPLERLVGQDAAEVRVPLEDDAVEVPRLALEPVGALEDAGEGGELRLRLGHGRLQPDVVLLRDGVQVQHHLVPVLPVLAVEVVDAAEVEEQLVVELRVVAEEARGLDPAPAVHGDRQVAAEVVEREDAVAERLGEDAGGGPGEDLGGGGGGEASHGALPWRSP